MRLFDGPGLVPALLVLGAVSAPPTGAPARVAIPAGGVEVPMRRIQGLPAVDVSINGSAPYRFVVDWGVNLLAVSPRVTAELKLPKTGVDEMGNPNVHIDALAVGGARFEGLTAAVDPFFADKQEQGVLGVNVYAEILLTLDYPHGLVRLETGSLPPADGKRVLACHSADGPEPAIEIALAGKRISVLLDTGASRLVMLPEKRMADLPLRAPPAPAGTAIGPQAGATRRMEARLRGDLSLGAFTVRDPLLTFHARPRAFLGGALLERFAVTLDQKGRRVRFARDSEAPIDIPPVP